MAKITIKIIDVDRTTNTIIVKYISEHSKNSIDDYTAVAFQLTDPKIKTPKQFIDSIRTLISQYVMIRDSLESNVDEIDFSTWNNFTDTIDSADLVSDYAPTQMIEMLANPEVIL